MQYRYSKQRPEIVKTLADKLTSGCLLTVWQKLPDGTRSFLQNMTFNALFPEEGVFTLRGQNNHGQKIDLNKEVYFLLEDHDFIFKTKMAVVQKGLTTLQIPREVRLREFRVHERKYFTLEEKKFVDVIFILKDSYTKMSITCPVVNISEGGACIVVSKETISNIDFSADLKLRFSSDFQIATIRNARIFLKKSLNTDDLYAIGVEFQEI